MIMGDESFLILAIKPERVNLVGLKIRDIGNSLLHWFLQYLLSSLRRNYAIGALHTMFVN